MTDAITMAKKLGYWMRHEYPRLMEEIKIAHMKRRRTFISVTPFDFESTILPDGVSIFHKIKGKILDQFHDCTIWTTICEGETERYKFYVATEEWIGEDDGW